VSRGGFHTITLGCKLNQFDSAAMEAELVRRGLPVEREPSRATVVIINTCTVTGKADAEARKLVRRVRRENPDCRLLVTGCYAESDPEAIQAMDGVDLVFGNRDKAVFSKILDELEIGQGSETPAVGDRGCDWPLTLPRALHFGHRSRAFLKVQEGCNLACSYCVIPQVRGPSRSVPPQEVEALAVSLLRSGYREIVLTGVNTGDYGRDLRPRTRLAELLRRLLAACGPNRIRLNSLEPRTLTDEVIGLMAEDARLAPHVQVPLQSGSDSILRRMRRNYKLSDYHERLKKLRGEVPHVGLGADVIVGFPGEADAHFEETYRFIEGSPLNYLHVFSWSPRPGTPASKMEGRVHVSVVRERSARLRELGARMGYRFRRGFEGERLDAVILGTRPVDGRTRALTGNFIEVVLEEDGAHRGDLVNVRVTRVTPEETRATLDGRPEWAIDERTEVQRRRGTSVSGPGATMLPSGGSPSETGSRFSSLCSPSPTTVNRV